MSNTGDGLVALNTVKELMADRGRPHDNLYEVASWADMLRVQGDELFYAYMVDDQAIVIPETIDAIRALAARVNDASESIATTNAALGIDTSLMQSRAHVNASSPYCTSPSLDATPCRRVCHRRRKAWSGGTHRPRRGWRARPSRRAQRGAAGGASARANGDGASRGRQSGVQTVVCLQKSGGTGALDQNLRSAVRRVFAKGNETGEWLAALDDFRKWLIREAA